MTRHHRRHAKKKAGLPPGSLVFVGEKRAERVRIDVIDFDAKHVDEREVADPDACRQYLSKSSVTWINVTGLHDPAVLARFGEVFEIHPLILEDILNTNQRPKIEVDGDKVFLVAKMLYRNERHEIVSEQVSLLCGPSWVLSFQEVEGDVFAPVRTRLREGKGRMRRLKSDYLSYALLDAIVDNYFVVLEEMGERIDVLHHEALEAAQPETLQRIQSLRSDLIFLRKALWPLREVVAGFEKLESPLVHPESRPFLRDLYEHAIQVIDAVESQRDLVSGALDLYMSSVSNRMNETMRVLTLIATIFIPITFIAGIYGMNFDHMPELHSRYGYFVALGGMGLIAAAMVWWFRRKDWL